MPSSAAWFTKLVSDADSAVFGVVLGATAPGGLAPTIALGVVVVDDVPDAAPIAPVFGVMPPPATVVSELLLELVLPVLVAPLVGAPVSLGLLQAARASAAAAATALRRQICDVRFILFSCWRKK